MPFLMPTKRNVVAPDSVIGPVYFVPLTCGIVPSVVYQISAPSVAQVAVTVEPSTVTSGVATIGTLLRSLKLPLLATSCR